MGINICLTASEVRDDCFRTQENVITRNQACVRFKADVETTKKISVDARPTCHSGAADTGMAPTLQMK